MTRSQNILSFRLGCSLYFLVQPFYLFQNKSNGNYSRSTQGFRNHRTRGFISRFYLEGI